MLTCEKVVELNGIMLGKSDRVCLCAIPGKWLLSHSVARWRSAYPDDGFQRVCKVDRLASMAAGVLDLGRSFPSAVVLATDKNIRNASDGVLVVPESIKFFVVDGQHRVAAQGLSEFEGTYSCVVHSGLSDRDMAELFLEINDNQRRVPSSLRWDLLRLVRDGEEEDLELRAAELVYELCTSKGGPLFQRVDLTGENKFLKLKQGSIAPSVYRLISGGKLLGSLSFSEQATFFESLFSALRDLDLDGWQEQKSEFFSARVVRGIMLAIPELIAERGVSPVKADARFFVKMLRPLVGEFAGRRIVDKQGNAGIKAIAEHVLNLCKLSSGR